MTGSLSEERKFSLVQVQIVVDDEEDQGKRRLSTVWQISEIPERIVDTKYRWTRLLPDRTIFTRRRKWSAYFINSEIAFLRSHFLPRMRCPPAKYVGAWLQILNSGPDGTHDWNVELTNK
jgi:hypothetical protein